MKTFKMQEFWDSRLRVNRTAVEGGLDYMTLLEMVAQSLKAADR